MNGQLVLDGVLEETAVEQPSEEVITEMYLREVMAEETKRFLSENRNLINERVMERLKREERERKQRNADKAKI